MTDNTKMIVMTVGLAVAVAALILFVIRDNSIQIKGLEHDDAASPNTDGSSSSS